MQGWSRGGREEGVRRTMNLSRAVEEFVVVPVVHYPEAILIVGKTVRCKVFEYGVWVCCCNSCKSNAATAAMFRSDEGAGFGDKGSGCGFSSRGSGVGFWDVGLGV
jgi:hypothetical protein